jgi:hypothetical protein
MGLVQYALKFRVTFYVLAILMLLGGIGSAIVAPKDVLPAVNIPVVVVVWTETGLDATDMASRIPPTANFLCPTTSTISSAWKVPLSRDRPSRKFISIKV